MIDAIVNDRSGILGGMAFIGALCGVLLVYGIAMEVRYFLVIRKARRG